MAEKFKILSAGGSSKGLNIFKSTAYKEHERKPMAQLFWSMRWEIGIWLVCAFAFALSFVVEHFWRYGVSPASWHWTKIYFKGIFYTGGMSVVAEIPAWLARSFARTDFACMVPLFPVIAYYFMSDNTLTKEFNPHGKDAFDEKSSNKANADDIAKMDLFDGFMTVLGYFKNKKKKSVPLMMNECLSTLLLAPAGTGKTVGTVIPTILECDTVSMIVNDVKPELKQLTSAYRATLGPVFIINWGERDEPEKGIYYPSWNPLSPENIPPDAEGRSTYIGVIVDTLIPEATGTQDPHWANTARAALKGFINFIVSKVERAKADDYFVGRLNDGSFDAEDASVLSDYYINMVNNPNAYAALSMLNNGELNATNYVHVGTWDGLPVEWIGHEASIPMFLAWYTEGQLRVAQKIEERKRQGDQMVMMEDPQKDFFNSAVNEASLYSYDPDAISALINLANTPDKERGSTLSTMNANLNIFRHPAVNAHTRHSDFHLLDMRGIPDPVTGKMKPVTVYLSINVADARAFTPITSLFIELMSMTLISNKPGTVSHGKEAGPFPALFVLDEMPVMNRLQAVIQGPSVGRGQKVSYLIVGQDISQIQDKYGDKAAETIIANTASKILLRVNDMQTATRFSEMMGQQIKIKKDKDGKESKESKPLFAPMDLMTMSVEKQIVMMQGYYNRPIEAEQARWYKNKSEAEKRLYAKVMMGEASPLPEYMIPIHHRTMGYDGQPRIYDPNTHEVRVAG